MQRGAPHGWCLYFEDTEYTPEDRRCLLINDLVAFFKEENAGWCLLSVLQNQSDRSESSLLHALCYFRAQLYQTPS